MVGNDSSDDTKLFVQVFGVARVFLLVVRHVHFLRIQHVPKKEK